MIIIIAIRSKLYGMVTMGNENEIIVTCKAGNSNTNTKTILLLIISQPDFDNLVQLVNDLERDLLHWSAEVDIAKHTLDKLRNEEFDISYNEEGKVTYKEKIVEDTNNVIKVVIHKNDSDSTGIQ